MQTAIQTVLSADLLSTVPSTIAAATSVQEECPAAVSRIDADTDAESVLTMTPNVAAVPVFDPAGRFFVFFHLDPNEWMPHLTPPYSLLFQECIGRCSAFVVLPYCARVPMLISVAF